MVRIRMQRLGRTHRPFFRIGATDSREPQQGKFIEQLGWYDPITTDETKQISLKEDRIAHWLRRGAQPSDTVRDLLGNRDLLPPKMKAEWEAEREISRKRVECKQAAKEAEAALAEFENLDAGETDIASFKSSAQTAVADAKKAVSKGAPDAAAKAKADATAALEGAKKAIAEAKPAPEASEAGESLEDSESGD